MQTSKTSGRVLVVGDNDLAALQLVRSLGRRGLEIHVVCYEQPPITRWSRRVSKAYHIGHPLFDTPDFVASLLQIIESEQFDLVIPVSDSSIVPLLSHRDQISRSAHFLVPDDRGYEATFDKLRTAEWATQLEIPIPATRLIVDSDGAQNELSSVNHAFPIVLKPRYSLRVGQTARNEVRIVSSGDLFPSALEQAVARGPVLLQEYCRGSQIGLGVLAQNGEIHAAFQHRQLHEEGSLATYRVSMPIGERLMRHAAVFCEALHWTGLALFEFIVDPATGEEKLLEINGRPWGSLGLAVFSGVDFPNLLYDMVVLKRVEKVFCYRVPIYARNTCRDVYWWKSKLFGTKSADSPRLKLIRAALEEAGNLLTLRERCDVESLTDPLPGIAAWFHFMRQSGRAALQRLRPAEKTAAASPRPAVSSSESRA